MSREVLESRQRGIRRMAATEWPIYDELVRDQRPGSKPTWQVVRGLCNGVPDRVDEYRTESEAREAWEGRWEATPREARKRKPIALTLSDEALKALLVLADSEGRSRSEIVEDLVLRRAKRNG